MKTKTGVILGLFIGLVAGAFGLNLYQSALPVKIKMDSNDKASVAVEEKPLYWVAPMDSNFRRDKPGKSPMGMDLIPVYKTNKNANDAGPGTIQISPDVVNNLGVRTANAKLKLMEPLISTVGYVQYNEDKLVHIHPRVEGWIEKLYVKAKGDPVEKGEPLYELYSPALVNAQEELVLALDRNNQRLVQASEDRLRALQIPETTIQKLKRTKKVSQTITFYSPQNGVVDNLTIREGFFVKPGTTMMSIGNLDEVWVEGEIFERQAALIQQGIPVTLSLDYLPGKDWKGLVDYVYPTLDEKTRTVRIRMRFENLSRELKPNMFAHVLISTTSNIEVLVVPRQSVIRTGNSDRVVLSLGGGAFKSIEVKVGRVGIDDVEILDGLCEDDEIVVSAQFLLDSESSKNSDFKRMHHAEPESNANKMMMSEDEMMEHQHD